MDILEIIANKRDKKELTSKEISFFIKEYTNGNIADYQAASLIMAIFLNGMNAREITDLTMEMAYSGEVLDLTQLNEIIVDKHSTGGVGDKVSLILLPLVASLGVPVAKMSGRGLGFTGGTVDKLESIPGYQTGIKTEQFLENVKEIGISMISQTMNLAPADKKLYALRDSIACVESIPLIASSIMSKKIASGAQKIVLDVTCGRGAFMKNMQEAEKLANQMIEIGRLANRETICVLTDMDEPLGRAVGNTLEVIEAIQVLKGEVIPDVEEVVLELGAYMMLLAGKGDDILLNKEKLKENLKNGKAYKKFLELVENQGGDISYLENVDKFEKARVIEAVYCNKSGFIQEINAKEIGELACHLGAGRIRKEDEIDASVGVVLNKKVTDKVEVGDILGYIHAKDEESMIWAKQKLLEIVKVGDKTNKYSKKILRVIS